MPQLITEDDLQKLDESYEEIVDLPDDLAEAGDEIPLSPAEHREMADVIEAWATDVAAYTLGGELTAPLLLLIAAEHRHAAGDTEHAHRLAGQARDHADAEPFEAHPTFIEFALVAGDTEAAAALAAEVLAARPVDLAFYTMIGESYEDNGDETTAERWYTLGLEMMADTENTDDPEYLGLLISRSMLRRDLGLPLDDFDQQLERFTED